MNIIDKINLYLVESLTNKIEWCTISKLAKSLHTKLKSEKFVVENGNRGEKDIRLYFTDKITAEKAKTNFKNFDLDGRVITSLVTTSDNELVISVMK